MTDSLTTCANEQSTTPLKRINSNASYSRMKYFQNCRFAFKLKYIDKLPENEKPPQLDTHGNPKPNAAERGSCIHDAAEQYVRSPTKPTTVMPELLDVRESLESARVSFALRANNKSDQTPLVLTEEPWFYNIYRDPLNSRTPLQWVRIDTNINSPTCVPLNDKGFPVDGYSLVVIIDQLRFDAEGETLLKFPLASTDQVIPTFAKITDYKSGKRFGNESSHATQTKLYTLVVAIQYPTIENFEAALLYTDQQGLEIITPLTRTQAIAPLNYWERILQDIENAIDKNDFGVWPHQSKCRFCAYGNVEHSNKWVNKTNACKSSIDHPNDAKWRITKQGVAQMEVAREMVEQAFQENDSVPQEPIDPKAFGQYAHTILEKTNPKKPQLTKTKN